MHYAHALGIGFLREEAVLHELVGEEYHVVHASVEETCEGFAQRVLRLDNRLVVPHDDGMTIEPQRTKQDDGFDAEGVRGIKHIVVLAAGQHFPSGGNHVPPSLVGMFLMMPHHIDAIVSQLQGAIKEVRREDSLLPFAHDALRVLCMVEVGRHII